MIKAYNNYLIIEPSAPEQRESGIELMTQEKPSKGTIFKRNDKSPFKNGDTVLFGKHVGVPVKLEDKDYLIIRDTDVFCTI